MKVEVQFHLTQPDSQTPSGTHDLSRTAAFVVDQKSSATVDNQLEFHELYCMPSQGNHQLKVATIVHHVQAVLGLVGKGNPELEGVDANHFIQANLPWRCPNTRWSWKFELFTN